MKHTDDFLTETLSPENPYRFIPPEKYQSQGIDPADVPLGTYASLNHPSQLQSKFGGNAYGFGLYEFHDRLKPEDIELIQSIAFNKRDELRKHAGKLNEIYKRLGLLVRLSRLGRFYYLIPTHIISNTLSNIRNKVNEISKIIHFHRKKYLIEHYDIGIVTHKNDLIIEELSFRFKALGFVILDSVEKLRRLPGTLDLIIITRDPYELIKMDKFCSLSQETLTKKRLDQYFLYLLWKIYGLLKPNGEIFIIANHYTPRTNRSAKFTFKHINERKEFAFFSHIYKTKKKYILKNKTESINIHDFQAYINHLYIDKEIVDQILNGRKLADLTIEQISKLPYLNITLPDSRLLSNQIQNWPKFLSIYFDQLFLKPLKPKEIIQNWKERFSCKDYSIHYMLIFLGQKKQLKMDISDIIQEVLESKLTGCPPHLLADYRDTFEYVIRTLNILRTIKNKPIKRLPQIYIDRIKQPFENRKRRFHALNHVIKLMGKINKLEKIKGYLNPDQIEGTRTQVIRNLGALLFFGFEPNEIKELLYIILGHTPLGRILVGKMNENALKPISDLARTYEPQQALNLLRFCLLMTLAETEAAKRSDWSQEELSELLDLYELTIRVVVNRELDWNMVMDEKTASVGGVDKLIVRKLLKMINHLEFLDIWPELSQKGRMEKEAISDYSDRRLSRIENVIHLVRTIAQFEKKFLRSDPLQLPILNRKFFNIEFHGTVHLFERMNSRYVFILLWITVNVSRGEIINFNPLLANIEPEEIQDLILKIEQEVDSIHLDELNLPVLNKMSDRLYKSQSEFVLGTGFHLKVIHKAHTLEISFTDIEKDIKRLDLLSNNISDQFVSESPIEYLQDLEFLFSNLDSFYKSHMGFLDSNNERTKIPSRQHQWFQRIQILRKRLRTDFLKILFRPEYVFTYLNLLYQYTPTFLKFILPQLMTLKSLDGSFDKDLKLPAVPYILESLRKLQALITHNKNYQDSNLLYKLAQKEFGPMAAGPVGVNADQIREMEKIIERLRTKRHLLDALVKSVIFQNLGKHPRLRKKYEGRFNPVEMAHAGAYFFEKENIAVEYQIEKEAQTYLIFLIRYHNLLHHIIRGEFSFTVLQTILHGCDPDLYDAFFVFSFIMLSSIKEDLILEDFADHLFRIRTVCQKIIAGSLTFKSHMDKQYLKRGRLYYTLDRFKNKGIPENMTPTDFIENQTWKVEDREKQIQAGKLIFGLERFFRLRGIRYVDFYELAKFIMKIPMQYIYRKKKLSSVGYSTFEKEIFEALRIYSTFQNIEEKIKNAVLIRLTEDQFRVFGFEKTSEFLSYENQIKLLLIGLQGTREFRSEESPIFLNFMNMSQHIGRRYEAVNNDLNDLSAHRIWEDKNQRDRFFQASTGITVNVEKQLRMISVDYRDRINLKRKMNYMSSIENVEQLKNYFHYSLRSLRENHFQTEGYEIQLEKVFEKKLIEINDRILDQTKQKMDLITDFRELHNLVVDLSEQTLELGFTEDQRHRLNDLYEIRQDDLKREKLTEIEKTLQTIQDVQELNDHWDSMKWYLQNNRRFFGKDFEYLVAKKFDSVNEKLL